MRFKIFLVGLVFLLCLLVTFIGASAVSSPKSVVVGVDYGLNLSYYRGLVDSVPLDYKRGLGSVYFSNVDCVKGFPVKTSDGYLFSCSKGLFSYFWSGRNSIKVSVKQSDSGVRFTLLHELGHLKQYNDRVFQSEFLADNFAFSLGNGLGWKF